nr:hypothetical protein [Polaromonas glacialis]
MKRSINVDTKLLAVFGKPPSQSCITRILQS